ncbi:MAG: glutamine amidotransferase, partial [Planctomycetota bacterium]
MDSATGSMYDAMPQNNRVTAYTYVSGKGRVLMIVDWTQPGEYKLLAERLRKSDIEVEVRPSNQLFNSLAELQQYDAVILAGCPRTSGDNTANTSSFTNEQIEMLVQNTNKMGCGLLMIGGRNGLGAGGWSNTKLEEAMPVDFQVKNQKVQAKGALAMIMHACEMPRGNYWQKAICRAAIEPLGPYDEVGILYWGMQGDRWLWATNGGGMHPRGLAPATERNKKDFFRRISGMTPGDMPAFEPSMRLAVNSLINSNAAVKHCIIISDGDPSAWTPTTLNKFKSSKITISTVTVAGHGPAASTQMQRLASATGGKYYVVNNGAALPKIFQNEARKVTRALIQDIPEGVVPTIVDYHPSIEGIDAFPPITGYVLTDNQVKPLAQQLLLVPESTLEQFKDKEGNLPSNTVLAAWNYGLGRTAVLTTDAGARWAQDWAEWENYDRFYSQLVRWLMRPTGDTGKFSMSTEVRDGEVHVVVNALDEDDEFLNFLDMQTSVTRPIKETSTGDETDGSPPPSIDLQMKQVAPGRYQGSFPVQSEGNYFVTVVPEPGSAPLTDGVSVPFGAEFRVRESNDALLENLAATVPDGGDVGLITQPLRSETIKDVIQRDMFTPNLRQARSIQDVWPWFIFAACTTLLAD